VAYQIGGKRHRLNFSDFDEAKSEAEAKAAQFSRGDVDAMQLTGRDRLVYGRAIEAVGEHGVPLDAAALEYGEARKLLDGVPVIDAVRFYLRHHGRGIKRKSVADAVDEMIAAKRAAGASELYQRYETAIENKLYRALNQLERLQRIRRGDQIPAPGAVDVNVHQDGKDMGSFGNSST
jgi:hypothetical protein